MQLLPAVLSCFFLVACSDAAFEVAQETFSDAAADVEHEPDAASDAGHVPDVAHESTILSDAAPEQGVVPDAVHEPDAACALPFQTPGDCVRAVCDGTTAKLISDFTDVPADDNNPCTDDVCVTGGAFGLATPSHPKKTPGAPCGTGHVCNTAGACAN